MTDYMYRCSWCLNKVILNIDHTLYLVCPICERRMLERVYHDVDDDIYEAFNKLLEHRKD
jgi:DNA-directed RNA polymerase subunit RPC12/RpoP